MRKCLCCINEFLMVVVGLGLAGRLTFSLACVTPNKSGPLRRCLSTDPSARWVNVGLSVSMA